MKRSHEIIFLAMIAIGIICLTDVLIVGYNVTHTGLFGPDGATKSHDKVTYSQLDPLGSQLHANFKHYNATIQTNASQKEIQEWLGDRNAHVTMNGWTMRDGWIFWFSENATVVYYED